MNYAQTRKTARDKSAPKFAPPRLEFFANHKPSGKAYGHYKVKKQYPGWNNRHIKPNPHYGKRYAYKRVQRPHYHKRHHPRPVPRRNVIYRSVKKDPVVVFKIVLKDILK